MSSSDYPAFATVSEDPKILELRHGSGVARFAPLHGGRLMSWTVNDTPIIHWPQDADWSKAASIRGGNPLLFPFIARHMVDGKQGLWRDAKGKEWQVPMHGFARNMPFEITTLNGGPQCSEATIGMRLTSNEKTLPGYPFQFIFDARYTLRDNALEVAVTATNTGNIPLPYYTGHHFYFALPSVERGQWRLELPAEQWGRQREDGSIAREDAPLKGDESVFSISDETLRDRFHLGGDFGGIVKLYRPGTVPDAAGAGGRSGTYIVLDLRPRDKELPWYCVTTWTQAADSDYYCVEPWLGLPNAIHHGEGLRWLAPGKTEKAVVRLSAW